MKKRISSYYHIRVDEENYIKAYSFPNNYTDEIKIELTRSEDQAKKFTITSSINKQEVDFNKLLKLFSNSTIVHYEIFKDEYPHNKSNLDVSNQPENKGV